MTVSPAKLNLFGTAVFNSRVVTDETQAQSSIASGVHPLLYFAAITDSFHNKDLDYWDLVFGFQ